MAKEIALCVDKDGVFADAEKLKADAFGQILQRHGSDKGKSIYKETFGIRGIDRAYRTVQRIPELGVSPEILDREWEELYSQMVDEGVEPILAGIEFLKSVDKSRYKLGCATTDNRSATMRMLQQFGIESLFDVVVTMEDVDPNRQKPFPDVYLCAAKKLGFDPRYCLGIEDSVPGLNAVIAAGMKSLVQMQPHNEGFRGELAKANYVVEDLRNVNLDEIAREW